MLHVEQVSIDHPDAQRLIAEVQDFYASLYGGSGDETPLPPDHFEPPQGAFFVFSLDGEAVATGAWRMRPDVAEEFGLDRPAQMPASAIVVTKPASIRSVFAVNPS